MFDFWRYYTVCLLRVYVVWFLTYPFFHFSWLSSVPSVLWRCWLCGRKALKNWLVGCWREWGADLCTAQLMPLPLSVSCFSEIRIGLPFWYRLTWVVLEKGPLNGCMFLTYLLPNLSFSLRIDLVRFQAGCYKRRLNQAFVFLCLFCVVVRFLWLVNACFCCVLGLVFFNTKPRDWLRGIKRLRNGLFCVEWDVKPQLSRSV